MFFSPSSWTNGEHVLDLGRDEGVRQYAAETMGQLGTEVQVGE